MAALVLIQLVMLPDTIAITSRVSDAQIRAGNFEREHREQLASFGKLGSEIRIGRRATILVDNTLSNGDYPLLVHFPLRSADGYGLRYSLDLFSSQPLSDRKLDSAFLDFVMSSTPVNRGDLTLLYSDSYLYLYKIAAHRD
jgi:hypothetical protein